MGEAPTSFDHPHLWEQMFRALGRHEAAADRRLTDTTIGAGEMEEKSTSFDHMRFWEQVFLKTLNRYECTKEAAKIADAALAEHLTRFPPEEAE